MKRGFTLIELLIVIAIIGILAAALLVSLGGARAAARDARRISDLRNVQAALELYFNKAAKYPGGVDNVAGQSWTNSTNGLKFQLLNAGIHGLKVPDDPNTAKHYRYGTIAGNQTYILGADLENETLQSPITACAGHGGAVDLGECSCTTGSTKLYCVGI